MGWIRERIVREYAKHGNRIDWALIAEKKIIAEINERLREEVKNGK